MVFSCRNSKIEPSHTFQYRGPGQKQKKENPMGKKMSKREPYNTTIDKDLIKQLKILSIKLEKRQNDLVEEAIKDLLEKYST